MQDYTKFKLKSANELSSMLAERDGFIVLACNKCFKSFTPESFDSSGTEPHCELNGFLQFADNLGKNVLLSRRLDFLCNERQLEVELKSISTSVNISASSLPSLFIIACGVGTQAVSSAAFSLNPEICVYTACNTIPDSGFHGMALSDKGCAACGQCFLSVTNGICPITGCPKKLLNGECGGAKDGKCEVDSVKDCAWSKISIQEDFRTLIAEKPPVHLDTSAELGAVHHNSADNIRVFDYDRIKFCDTNALSSHIRSRKLESFYGGVYLKYRKVCTAFLTLKNFPLPKKVVIPMSQHAGMSAEPIVGAGDYVRVGQKIGEAVGTLSSCIHASVSGVVSNIAYNSHLNSSQDTLCITIESDGKDELHKSVKPIPYWEDLDIFDIDAIIAEKGIVGMGGAGFPTPVKLKSPKPIDTILLNGCESEPYITADHRVMLEYADDIVSGLRIMQRCTGAERGIIVISDNKSDAIMHLEAKTAQYDDIFVMALWSKYPQGAERMLIARALGRHLAYNQRPYDLGVIVINVSTARAIGDAFMRGMPLIERAVTVSGDRIENSANFMVRIGTSASDILDYCGVIGDDATIKMGGPMMGTELNSLDVPVIKGSNGIVATAADISCSTDCVRCGRCVDVCPMELLPLYFPVYAKREDWRAASGFNVQLGKQVRQETNALNCIECGACDYICPSKIKIREAIRVCKRSRG